VQEFQGKFDQNKPVFLSISSDFNTYSLNDSGEVQFSCLVKGADTYSASDGFSITWSFLDAVTNDPLDVFFNNFTTTTSAGSSSFNASVASFNVSPPQRVKVCAEYGTTVRSNSIFIDFIP
jgi:hypothetical protein